MSSLTTALATSENTPESDVANAAAGGDAANNGSEAMAVDDAASALLSMGPLLPANPEDMTCYCGKERDLMVSEFQCGMCLRFYHDACISCLQGGCMPFMTNYQFFCKRCSGQESFVKRPASFSQMCHTALANLIQKNPDRELFSKDKEVIPFIDEHWDSLTTAPRRVKNTWHSSIAKTMRKDLLIFTCQEEAGGDCSFGLVNRDLTKIGPNCEHLLRLACSTAFRAPAETKGPASTAAVVAPAPPEPKGRASKRKGPDVTGLKQRRGDAASSARLTPKHYPSEHPYNKDGYRYHLAEPDPHAPNWVAFDESVEWAGKPIPGYLYRAFLEPRVLLSLNDRAPQLKLSDDRLTVTGEKGYSMIRGTHGVRQGSWFFEIRIDDMPSETAARLGWSQSLGNLQAPCGYDKFSYSWRSRKGTRFHASCGKHYAQTGYGEKDVLGFLICLPTARPFSKLVPPTFKDKPLVKFKSHLYYEEKDHVAETEKNLKPLKGSKMMMYKNGVCQGVAFEDCYDGMYYPAISLYKSTTVTVNFGPRFKFPPKDQPNYLPMSRATDDAYVHHTVGDLLYHIEHEGQQPEF